MEQILKNKYLILLLLLILFLLSRSFILLKSPYIFHPEEIRRGCIAQGITEGLNLSLFDYQHTHYEGGSLLVGFLLIPLFKIFGSTILSMKILAILFSAGIFITIYILLYNCLSSKAAILGGLLFIFAPPYYLLWDFMVFGNYHENIFFTFLSIFLFYLAVFKSNSHIILILIFGFICGLSLWVHASFLITILAILLIWYATNHRVFISKKFCLFVIAFLIGFSLWIFYNIKFNFAGLEEFYDAFIGDGNILKATTILKKLFVLIFYNLPMMFQYKRTICNYLYYLLFCVAFVFILYQNRMNFKNLFLSLIPKKMPANLSKHKWFEMIIVLHFLIYLFAYIISDYERIIPEFKYGNIEYNTYLYSFLPFMLLIIVFYIENIIKNSRFVKHLNMGFVGVLLIINCYEIKNLTISSQNNKKILTNNAFDHKLLYTGIGQKYKDNIEYFRSLEKRVPEVYKSYLYYGLGLGFGDHLEYGTPLKYIEKTVNTLDNKYRLYIYIAMGTENGGVEGDLFLQKGLPNVTKEYTAYYNLGLSISDVITERRRFLSISESLAKIPEIEQKTIREFIDSLQGYIIPYQWWQKTKRD